MKLFKKILPIATIASTVAVVAPTLASCNKSTIALEDITGYKAKVEQHAAVTGADAWDNDKATQEYFKDSNIHKIFVDDQYVFLGDTSSDDSFKIEAGLADISFVENTEKKCFIGTYRFAATVTDNYGTSETITHFEIGISGVPLIVQYSDVKMGWYVCPIGTNVADEELNAKNWHNYNEGWSVNSYMSMEQKFNGISAGVISAHGTANKDCPEIVAIGSGMAATMGLLFQSNYLAKVEYKK